MESETATRHLRETLATVADEDGAIPRERALGALAVEYGGLDNGRRFLDHLFRTGEIYRPDEDTVRLT